MEIRAGDVQAGHFFVRCLDPFPVGVDIEICLDRQPLAGLGVGQ
jgi:hypothetical protein